MQLNHTDKLMFQTKFKLNRVKMKKVDTLPLNISQEQRIRG